MVALQVLDRATGLPYLPLTCAGYRARIAAGDADGVAVGASVLGQPVGLALASIGSAPRTAELLSLFVTSPHRGQGMAKALMARLEEELCRYGCAGVTCTYAADKPSTPAFERVLSRRSWDPPRKQGIFFRGDRRVLAGPWMRRHRLPPGFGAFPWVEVSGAELSALARAAEPGGWVPEWASPLQHPEYLAPAYSMGLRHEGEVVGWMLTHRVRPDTLAYAVLFVREEYRAGCGLPLLAAALERQFGDPAGPPFATCMARVENTPMATFIDHWLRPYALRVWESRTSRKAL